MQLKRYCYGAVGDDVGGRMAEDMRETAAAQTGVACIEGHLIGLNAGSGIKAKDYSGIFLWQELLVCPMDEQVYVIRENLLTMFQHCPVCADLVNENLIHGPLRNSTLQFQIQKRGNQYSIQSQPEAVSGGRASLYTRPLIDSSRLGLLLWMEVARLDLCEYSTINCR